MLKQLSLMIFVIGTLNCSQKKQIPVITPGACGDTVMLYLFFNQLSDEEPSVMAPTPRGCRCSIMIDGKEFVSTQPEESYAKCLKQSL